MQKKFAKFLYAVRQADHEHVSEQLKEVFNDAGLNHLVTGQFPKVRMKVHISLCCVGCASRNSSLRPNASFMQTFKFVIYILRRYKNCSLYTMLMATD